MLLMGSREEPECWELKDDRAWQEGGQEGGQDIVETLKDLSRAVSQRLPHGG